MYSSGGPRHLLCPVALITAILLSFSASSADAALTSSRHTGLATLMLTASSMLSFAAIGAEAALNVVFSTTGTHFADNDGGLLMGCMYHAFNVSTDSRETAGPVYLSLGDFTGGTGKSCISHS
jgi:hypothetical protein